MIYMKNFKKIISLCLLLFITIASTIPAYALENGYEKSDVIYVDGQKFRIYLNGGYDLEYYIMGDFDKAELAVKVTYDGDRTYHFGNQTFRNSDYCKYNDKGYYKQINGCSKINEVKAWVRITKNEKSEEKIIYLD